MTQAFGTAINGRSKERQAIADTELDLEARLPVLACQGGEEVLRKLFEPLGYEVLATHLPLDEAFPEWGQSRYYDVTIKGRKKLNELLRHLYVLIPVLDNAKHYWISGDEIDKLLRHAEDWLTGHPEKQLIVRRYFSRRSSLAREALERLVIEESEPEEGAQPKPAASEEALEAKISLNQVRMEAVKAVLLSAGAKRVLDLGCGEGKLLRLLFKERQFEELVGLDVSLRSLENAEQSLHLEDLPIRQKGRLKLLHGSLMYRDRRLQGFDAAACIEVMEHLDAERLRAFERALFEFAKPPLVVLTTPNREFNARFENLAPGSFRHSDHRFEWTRAEFKAWADKMALQYGYAWRWEPVGELDPELGPPTQMAVFTAGVP